MSSATATAVGTRPEYPEAPNYKRITLKKLGPQLPLGVVDANGNLNRGVSFRPWTGKEEREVGDLMDKNREAPMAQYIAMVLSTMCKTLGHHNFEGMEDTAKRAVISQMYSGDVFYAFALLRREVMGSQLDLEIVCNLCRSKFNWAAGLDTLEINTAESVESSKWKYTLESPFVIRDSPVSELVLGPFRWHTIEDDRFSGSLNLGMIKMAMIHGCIVEVPNRDNMVLAEHELDGMLKVDIEELAYCINESHLGPDMSIETRCKTCKNDIIQTIDWSYGSFFGRSSQPSKRRISTKSSSP